jgi:hypothetical protein
LIALARERESQPPRESVAREPAREPRGMLDIVGGAFGADL